MNLRESFEGRENKISADDIQYGGSKNCYSDLFNISRKDDITTNYVTHCIRLDIIEIAAEEV